MTDKPKQEDRRDELAATGEEVDIDLTPTELDETGLPTSTPPTTTARRSPPYYEDDQGHKTFDIPRDYEAGT